MRLEFIIHPEIETKEKQWKTHVLDRIKTSKKLYLKFLRM